MKYLQVLIGFFAASIGLLRLAEYAFGKYVEVMSQRPVAPT